MTLKGLEIFKLFEELEKDEITSKSLADLSSRTVKMVEVLVKRGVLGPAKACRPLLDELQADVLNSDLWRKLYSCLARVGIESTLGVECADVDEVDVRVLEYGISKESVEVFKVVDRETKAKICALARDYDALKKLDEILSYIGQVLPKIYTTSRDCLSRYRQNVAGLLRKYDIRSLHEELSSSFGSNVFESLIELGVQEGKVEELMTRILTLETKTERPILRYLVLRLKGLEKLRRKLVEECSCAIDPAAYQGEVDEFLKDLGDNVVKLGRLLGRVEGLKYLADGLCRLAPVGSLDDIIKIVEMVEKVGAASTGVSEIERLVEVLLNNADSEGKVDLSKVYEEIKRRGDLMLLDVLLRLCGEGAFKCSIHIY